MLLSRGHQLRHRQRHHLGLRPYLLPCHPYLDTASHASWHTSCSWHTGSTSSLVNSHHDWVEFGLKLLLLALDDISLSILVTLEPLKTLISCGLDGSLVLIGEGLLEFLLVESVLHLEAVVLESVLSFDLSLGGFVLSLELL